METGADDKKKTENRRVHMANERTFLAWVRTSIGVMAFGFVVERFAFFLRQLVYYSEHLGRINGRAGFSIKTPKAGYSAVLGIALVAFGMLMTLLAFIRFLKVRRQIDEGTYRPSAALNVTLTAFVLAIGFLLLAYLIRSF